MTGSGTYLSRPSPSGLADVVEIILDRGIVIDAYVRVSLLGIELLTIDARGTIASVDTYLRFAESVNRLDLFEHGGRALPDVLAEGTEHGVRTVAADVVEDKVDRGLDKVGDAVGGAVGDAVEAVAEKAVDVTEEAAEKVADAIPSGGSDE